MTVHTKEFGEAFAQFLKGSQQKLNTGVLEVEWNARYVRVIHTDPPSRSAHCFVDRTNGDVLKSASWKAPAKHARGNIFNDDNGVDCMGEYGAVYLR